MRTYLPFFILSLVIVATAGGLVGCQNDLGLEEERFACESTDECASGYECVDSADYGSVCRPAGESNEADASNDSSNDTSNDVSNDWGGGIVIHSEYARPAELSMLRLYRLDRKPCSTTVGQPAGDVGSNVFDAVEVTEETLPTVELDEDEYNGDLDELFVVGHDREHPHLERAIGCVEFADVEQQGDTVVVDLPLLDRYPRLAGERSDKEYYTLVNEFSLDGNELREIPSFERLMEEFDHMYGEGVGEVTASLAADVFELLQDDAIMELAIDRYGVPGELLEFAADGDEESHREFFRCLEAEDTAMADDSALPSDFIDDIDGFSVKSKASFVPQSNDDGEAGSAKVFDFALTHVLGNISTELCDGGACSFEVHDEESGTARARLERDGEIEFGELDLGLSPVQFAMEFGLGLPNVADLMPFEERLYEVYDCRNFCSDGSDSDVRLPDMCSEFINGFESLLRLRFDQFREEDPDEPTHIIRLEPSGECGVFEPDEYEEEHLLPLGEYIGEAGGACGWEAEVGGSMAAEVDLYTVEDSSP